MPSALSWPDLAAFMLATLVLNATPGVDLLLTVSRTLAGGRRAGVAAALGINAGCMVYALAAASGLAALFALAPRAYGGLQVVGAAYLLWLAYGAWRRAGSDGQTAGPELMGPPPSPFTDFRTGLLTNLLNPKVALFFVAFLPQFVDAASDRRGAALLLLGGVFVAQSTAFLLLVVVLASGLRQITLTRGVRRVLNALSGGLFALLAVRLLLSEPPPG